jgi:hypothetical protein
MPENYKKILELDKKLKLMINELESEKNDFVGLIFHPIFYLPNFLCTGDDDDVFIGLAWLRFISTFSGLNATEF